MVLKEIRDTAKESTKKKMGKCRITVLGAVYDALVILHETFAHTL